MHERHEKVSGLRHCGGPSPCAAAVFLTRIASDIFPAFSLCIQKSKTAALTGHITPDAANRHGTTVKQKRLSDGLSESLTAIGRNGRTQCRPREMCIRDRGNPLLRYRRLQGHVP